MQIHVGAAGDGYKACTVIHVQQKTAVDVCHMILYVIIIHGQLMRHLPAVIIYLIFGNVITVIRIIISIFHISPLFCIMI